MGFKDVTVLLVEDHANMRVLWRTILLGFGIRKVLEAPDATSAFEILRDDTVDVLIVDFNLEGLSGAELMRLIRRSDDMPYMIPAIACTADTRRSTLKELVNAGVDEVLAKPVSAEQAWKKLSVVVNNRRKFVSTPLYLGPCRRRKDQHYSGPDRRKAVVETEQD